MKQIFFLPVKIDIFLQLFQVVSGKQDIDQQPQMDMIPISLCFITS